MAVRIKVRSNGNDLIPLNGGYKARKDSNSYLKYILVVIIFTVFISLVIGLTLIFSGKAPNTKSFSTELANAINKEGGLSPEQRQNFIGDLTELYRVGEISGDAYAEIQHMKEFDTLVKENKIHFEESTRIKEFIKFRKSRINSGVLRTRSQSASVDANE